MMAMKRLDWCTANGVTNLLVFAANEMESSVTLKFHGRRPGLRAWGFGAWGHGTSFNANEPSSSHGFG